MRYRDRKKNSMYYKSQIDKGVLNIIKLPSCDAPILDNSEDLEMPELGKPTLEMSQEMLDFHDVNENYDS